MKEQIGDIIIYKDIDGKEVVDVTLANETLWLSLNQISSLFERDKSVISRHLRNIFKEEELIKEQAVAFFATVQNEGCHLVERNIEYFNLDAIISVGYRVNSKRGTHFRKWASSVLKDHLVNGYSINNQKITAKKIKELQSVIELLSKTLTKQELVSDVGIEVIEIIKKYAKTWELLLRYDEDRLEPTKTKDNLISLDYEESKAAIETLKKNLIAKNEASSLFGNERDDNLSSIIGNVVQTFDGTPIYFSNLERATIFLRSSHCGSIHSAPDAQNRIVFVISPLIEKTSNLLDEYFDKPIVIL